MNAGATAGRADVGGYLTRGAVGDLGARLLFLLANMGWATKAGMPHHDPSDRSCDQAGPTDVASPRFVRPRGAVHVDARALARCSSHPRSAVRGDAR